MINNDSEGFVLKQTNREWLKLCLANESVINDLFDLFGKDESFKKHKALSQYADPMTESGKNTWIK